MKANIPKEALINLFSHLNPSAVQWDDYPVGAFVITDSTDGQNDCIQVFTPDYDGNEDDVASFDLIEDFYECEYDEANALITINDSEVLIEIEGYYHAVLKSRDWFEEIDGEVVEVTPDCHVNDLYKQLA